MKLLQLSGGETVIVDDEDYVRLNQYKWYVRKVKSSRRVLKYVVRSAVNEGHKIIIVLSKDVLGCASELCVIHRDGDYLNHTKANLLAATRSEVLGMKLKKRGGTSQYKGVSWKSKKNKWRAQITVNRKIFNMKRTRLVHMTKPHCYVMEV